jgi:peptidoglycan/xylan/chitin deacetylase (PgdA/CDA1 family)
LALAKVSATFFVLGTNIEEARWCGGDVTHAESVVLRMLREGLLVGNHTWSHMSRDDAALDLGRFRTDLLRGEHAIRRLLVKCGLDGNRFVPFRLPYGPQSPAIIDGQLESPLSADPRLGELRKLGLSHSHWSGGFQDWAPVSGGEEELCRQLCEHTAQEVARGRDAVLLLHDGGPPGAPGSVSLDRSSTVHGVRRFLDRAKALGWRHFVFAAAHAGQ